MTLNEFLKANIGFNQYGSHQFKLVMPVITCKDGFTISVQASKNHYCSPRTDGGPYTQVECGYPSGPVSEALKEYADDPDDHSTIYPFVPIHIVEDELNLHGGIA